MKNPGYFQRKPQGLYLGRTPFARLPLPPFLRLGRLSRVVVDHTRRGRAAETLGARGVVQRERGRLGFRVEAHLESRIGTVQTVQTLRVHGRRQTGCCYRTRARRSSIAPSRTTPHPHLGHPAADVTAGGRTPVGRFYWTSATAAHPRRVPGGSDAGREYPGHTGTRWANGDKFYGVFVVFQS